MWSWYIRKPLPMADPFEELTTYEFPARRTFHMHATIFRYLFYQRAFKLLLLTKLYKIYIIHILIAVTKKHLHIVLILR